MDWKTLRPLDLSKINFVSDYPRDKYFKVAHPKKQIILHHTVSGPGIRGDLKTWINNEHKVGTCVIIDNDGTPNQLFSSKYWAYHSTKGSRVDKYSIGIEFDSWGPLVKGTGESYNFGTSKNPRWKNTEEGAFYAVYGNKVNCEVQHYPEGFRHDAQKRTYYYYEKYSDEAIKTAGELILLWRDRYGIPMTYNEDMWEVSQRAIDGTPGIWSHTSYIPAPRKTDCHPQPELIEMLKTLSEIG